MNYLEKRKEYVEHFLETDLISLEKESIVKDFLDFMEKNFDQGEEYFQLEFKKDKEEERGFIEYTYNVHMGLEKDLEKEYEEIRLKWSGRVSEIEKQIIKIIKKYNEIEDKKSYQGRKLEFTLNFNLELLKKAEEKNSEKERRREAWNRARWLAIVTNWFIYDMFDELEFSDPKQDELFDWKHNINFQELPVSESRRMLELKKDNKDQYLIEFEKYIEEYQVCEEIKRVTKENYYLLKRLPIIEVAINCFYDKKYLPFISLIVPQIEGMFTDYMDIIGISSKGNSITEKLERLNNRDRLWGYIYYAFDFPEIRNDVAHGYIIEKDLEETAFDILLDLNYLIKMCDSEELEYKKVVERLTKIDNCRETSEKTNILLEHIFLKEDEAAENEINLVKKIVSNNFDDILKWYGLDKEPDSLKQVLESKEFYKQMDDGDVGIKVKEKFVKLLSKHIAIPEDWRKKLFAK